MLSEKTYVRCMSFYLLHDLLPSLLLFTLMFLILGAVIAGVVLGWRTARRIAAIARDMVGTRMQVHRPTGH